MLSEQSSSNTAIMFSMTMQIASRQAQTVFAAALRASTRRPAAFASARTATPAAPKQLFYGCTAGFSAQRHLKKFGMSAYCPVEFAEGLQCSFMT
jgi:hypothetical protein